MTTESKDAPSEQSEAELAPPLAFTVIHSSQSAAESPVSAADQDVESAPEGESDLVESGLPETSGASAAETRQSSRADAEKAVADAPAVAVRINRAKAPAGFEDFAAARDQMVAINVKAFQTFLANAETSLDFLTALASAKSLSELIALQSRFAYKQIDAMMRPAAEISAMTQKTMANAVESMRDQVTRSVKY